MFGLSPVHIVVFALVVLVLLQIAAIVLGYLQAMVLA